MSSRSARLALWNATTWPRRLGFHGAGGEGSQVIIPFIIVERGLSWVLFEIPRRFAPNLDFLRNILLI
ncbi:MAG TPA: hypothetical protein VE868_06055 [Balneolaceae bacterium]|nr:hypothetical protein [Balneolaceae bacterium]